MEQKQGLGNIGWSREFNTYMYTVLCLCVEINLCRTQVDILNTPNIHDVGECDVRPKSQHGQKSYLSTFSLCHPIVYVFTPK